MSARDEGDPAAEAGQGERGFDAALEELETLVAGLEDGGLDLERAIDQYKRGIGLLKSCHATLERYRKEVEELTDEAEEALRPFEGAPEDAPGAGSEDRVQR